MKGRKQADTAEVLWSQWDLPELQMAEVLTPPEELLHQDLSPERAVL